MRIAHRHRGLARPSSVSARARGRASEGSRVRANCFRTSGTSPRGRACGACSANAGNQVRRTSCRRTRTWQHRRCGHARGSGCLGNLGRRTTSCSSGSVSSCGSGQAVRRAEWGTVYQMERPATCCECSRESWGAGSGPDRGRSLHRGPARGWHRTADGALAPALRGHGETVKPPPLRRQRSGWRVSWMRTARNARGSASY